MELPQDPDFFTKAHSPTKLVYRDVYPAIDPSTPALSQSGKIVVITGASRGLGRRGFAASFARAGAKAIVITARNKASLDETEALIKKINPGVDVLGVEVEMTNETSVKHAFDQIAQRFGTVDILVNNAGVSTNPEMIKDTASEEWWKTIDINVRGQFLVVQYFLKLLGDKHGVVINLTSGAGLAVIPGFSAYSLAKQANLKFTAFIAAEHSNITAVALSPGIVHTDMTADFFVKYAKDTPELVGGAGVWLTTPAASFLNGRYFSVSWDVQELVKKKDDIVKGNQLTLSLLGDFAFGEIAK